MLLDTGDCAPLVAEAPLDIFWKMKAFDVVGRTRGSHRGPAAVGPGTSVGSVWLVDAELRAAPDVPPVPGGAARATGRSPLRSAVRLHPLALLAGIALAGFALSRMGHPRPEGPGRSTGAAPAAPSAASVPTAPSTASLAARPAGPPRPAAEAGFRIRIRRLHALDRVAIGLDGARLLDTLDLGSLLPAFQPDPA